MQRLSAPRAAPTRRWLIALVALISASLTALSSLPAAYLAPVFLRLTQNHLRLDEVSGTLWQGQAVLTLQSGVAEPARLPGTFAWTFDPLSLWLGQLNVTVRNTAVLDTALNIRVSISGRTQANSGSAHLPAATLVGWGAPWNTIGPGGSLLFSWAAIDTNSAAAGARTADSFLDLRWIDATSRLTVVNPLGTYHLNIMGLAPGSKIHLETLSGPMEVLGDGTIGSAGDVRFQGLARVRPGTDERTANQVGSVVSLFGPHHGDEVAINVGI